MSNRGGSMNTQDRFRLVITMIFAAVITFVAVIWTIFNLPTITPIVIGLALAVAFVVEVATVIILLTPQFDS